MSTNEYWDDEDRNDEGRDSDRRGGPKALREALEKEKERRKAIEAKFAELEGQLRTRTISDVLSSKGANPRLAKYVARDLEGDFSDDDVVKWLNEEGTLFGYKPSEDEGGNAEDDAERLERERQAAAGGGATAPDAGSDALAKISAATTPEELEAAMLEIQAGRG